MSGVAQAQLASTFQFGMLPFGTIGAQNANGTLNTPFTSITTYTAHTNGSILGFAGTLGAGLTTGTLTFQPTINGSLCPAFPDAASLRTNQTSSYYVQEARTANYTFVAGDRLGVMITKAGTVNPTTADVGANLIVLFENVRV